MLLYCTFMLGVVPVSSGLRRSLQYSRLALEPSTARGLLLGDDAAHHGERAERVVLHDETFALSPVARTRNYVSTDLRQHVPRALDDVERELLVLLVERLDVLAGALERREGSRSAAEHGEWGAAQVMRREGTASLIRDAQVRHAAPREVGHPRPRACGGEGGG